MRQRDRGLLLIWLAALAWSLWTVFKPIPLSTDLTAFLPASPRPVEQVVIDQLKEGVASRLILMALEGDDPAQLADASKKLATTLQSSGRFHYVRNGEQAGYTNEQDVLFANRYALSPTVTASRFETATLHRLFEENAELLASPTGMLVKRFLPADPTREFFSVVEGITPSVRPTSIDGVWFSHDGRRALLIAESVAPGFDIAAQRRNIELIDKTFADLRRAPAVAAITMSGPAIFAVELRDRIEGDSLRLSLIALITVALILTAVYRRFSLVLLALVPAASGLLAGIAVVGTLFDEIHGITLGFAAILIGEAVDYPSYFYIHKRPTESLADTGKRVWPILRLAVLTTVLGATALALSNFEGLAQLGLLAMTGALVAGWVTRHILPLITPGSFVETTPFIRVDTMRKLPDLRRGRLIVLGLAAVSAVYIATQSGTLWEDDLGALSPLPEEAKITDRTLRMELGAPDVRYLVVAEASNREMALQRAEAAGRRLDEQITRGHLAGFDTPARYLPSEATQRERLTALPDRNELEKRLQQALVGTPFNKETFGAFIDGVEHARSAPPVSAHAYAGTAISSGLQSMLMERGNVWFALLPLHGVKDADALAQAISTKPGEGIHFVDLKTSSSRMVERYRSETLSYVALGAALIFGVLGWGLKSLSQAIRVLTPVAFALAVVVALLVSMTPGLTVFHLVALLLVLGIGLNYALFFQEYPRLGPDDSGRTLLALGVCSLTTLSAFGALATSQTPVLHAIGLTVSLGTVASLLIAGLWSPHSR